MSPICTCHNSSTDVVCQEFVLALSYNKKYLDCEPMNRLWSHADQIGMQKYYFRRGMCVYFSVFRIICCLGHSRKSSVVGFYGGFGQRSLNRRWT